LNAERSQFATYQKYPNFIKFFELSSLLFKNFFVRNVPYKPFLTILLLTLCIELLLIAEFYQPDGVYQLWQQKKTKRFLSQTRKVFIVFRKIRFCVGTKKTIHIKRFCLEGVIETKASGSL
jgi:hypothetical protein